MALRVAVGGDVEAEVAIEGEGAAHVGDDEAEEIKAWRHAHHRTPRPQTLISVGSALEHGQKTSRPPAVELIRRTVGRAHGHDPARAGTVGQVPYVARR